MITSGTHWSTNFKKKCFKLLFKVKKVTKPTKFRTICALTQRTPPLILERRCKLCWAIPFLMSGALHVTTFAANFGAGRLERGIRCEYPALACLQQNSQQMSSHVAPLSRISCTRFRTKCADKLWWMKIDNIKDKIRSQDSDSRT